MEGRPDERLTQLTQSSTVGPNVFTVAEYNFSIFFGLAIREYERILIADDTPFDRYMEGKTQPDGSDYINAQQIRGFQLFLSKARCVACHSGPELTNAGVTSVVRRGQLMSSDGFPVVPDLLERMIMGDGGVAVYDTGHYNIGVRPTSEDVGLGGDHRATEPAAVEQPEIPGVRPAAGERWGHGRGGERRLRRGTDPGAALRGGVAAAAGGGAGPATRPMSSRSSTRGDALNGPNDPLVFVDSSPLAASYQYLSAQYLITTKPGGQKPAVKKLLDGATMLLPDFSGSGAFGFGLDELNPVAPPLQPGERVAVDGSFKTPGLRNVALTAPYFHNGGQLALAQVVEFYNRGSDFGAQNADSFDPNIQPLGLTAGERSDLVAFLEALTDDRVRRERAPFDHPSISLPNGGTRGKSTMAYFPGFPVLDDRFELPEVGSDRERDAARYLAHGVRELSRSTTLRFRPRRAPGGGCGRSWRSQVIITRRHTHEREDHPRRGSNHPGSGLQRRLVQQPLGERQGHRRRLGHGRDAGAHRARPRQRHLPRKGSRRRPQAQAGRDVEHERRWRAGGDQREREVGLGRRQQ